MTKALLLDKSYELLDSLGFPDVDDTEVVDLELRGVHGLWIHRGKKGYITFESENTPGGVRVLDAPANSMIVGPIIVCDVRVKPFAIEIRTPKGWNVITRFSSTNLLLICDYRGTEFCADICAKSDSLFVVKKKDGTCGLMYIPKGVDGSYTAESYNVFRRGVDGSLFDLLKGDGDIYDMHKAYNITKTSQSRLIGFGSKDSKTLIDCAGRIIAEGVSGIEKMSFDEFRVWRNGDGGKKECNALLYDESGSIYRVAFDRWGEKLSRGCPLSREMALNKTVRYIDGHDDDDDAFTLFYDDGFSIALMDNLLGVSMFAEGAVFNDVAEIALSNGRKLYVYVTADGRKSVVVSPDVFHQLKSIDNDNGNKAMMFDRVEADYENQFVRGYAGNDVYLYDIKYFDTQCNKAPRKESDVVFCHGNAAVYMEGGTKKYAVNADRGNDKMDYYDDIVVMPHENGDVCMYGYDKDDDNYRQIIMLT